MFSIRSKIAILIAFAVSVSVSVVTVIGAKITADLGHSKTEQAMALLCESGKHNLDGYFGSVSQSIDTISDIANERLDELSQADYATEMHNHLEDIKGIFTRAAENTAGALTFYYRLDPSITEETGEKGFWLINLDGKGFVDHEVTDLSDDHFEARWFYQPKERGEPLWLSPYFTDNLDVYVISYNVPVYRNKSFVGVVGIEIDYHTLGDQVKDIKVLKTGFAYIVDDRDGSIIYHPHLDIVSMPEADRPAIPDEFLAGFQKGAHHIEYTFQGVRKHCAWLGLSNGMSIVVAVPDTEVVGTWLYGLLEIIFVGIGLTAVFVFATILFARHITRPLKQLTAAAKQINEGNYNVSLDYKGNDEIGVLTDTFNGLIKNLGEYITDLNNLAYEDALTLVGNKSAFDVRVAEIQKKIDEGKEKVEFAIAMLDTDELKKLNDEHGHDKGDIYLRNSCNLMCHVFEHSVTYRIGGDEFAIILEGEDYADRENLRGRFIERSGDISAFAKEPWEKVCVSIGVATYDPQTDKSVNDVLIRADHLMYSNKRQRKKH